MVNKGVLNLAIEELKNDKNNAVAFVYENPKSGEGLLNDCVITLKDNYATDDAPTQGSSLLLKGFTPKYDAEIVKRLKKAGGTIIGKTHLDELALGGTGSYSAFGVINNPLDEKRMPGGSSSGAAATFTKNVGLAIGSDTGDSVRLPASYIGVVGYKPSFGAVSRFGLFPFASSMDTVSWFTHNVEDTILASQVLYGVDKKDSTSIEVSVPENEIIKPKKVSYINFGDLISKKATAEYEKTINKFKEDGIEVQDINVDVELMNLIGVVYSVISYSESSSNNSNLNGISFGNSNSEQEWAEKIIETRTNGFGDMVKRRFSLGSFFLLPENQDKIFRKAQKVRRAIKNYFDEILKDSILVYPTATIAPLWADGKKDNWYSSFLSYSNLIGNPSISIPWTNEEEMPINLSIDGKTYEDKELLSNVLYIEKLLGGNHE